MVSFHSFFTRRAIPGFTLIEALVLLAVFSILTLGFYNLYILAMTNIIESKKRLVAVELANQELEVLRNTPYEEIALATTPTPPTGSVGFGSMLYDSTITFSDIDYRILKEIYYIDDPTDGLSTDPNPNTDALPADYKNVIISVLWGKGVTDASIEKQKVQLSSYFIPPGGNELGIMDGIISINVVDVNGSVSGIYVEIDDVNGTAFFSSGTTDDSGNIIFGSVPAAQDEYRITVGDGTDSYEIISTLPTVTSWGNPLYTDLSSVAGTITALTVTTEKLPNLDFFVATDPYCKTVGVASFDLIGGRFLGTDFANNDVFLNGSLTTMTVTTDSGGILDLSTVPGYEASAGYYEVVSPSVAGHTFWKLSPGDDTNRFATQALPGEDFNCGLIFLDNATDSVLVTVTDSDTGFPLSEADVRLSNSGLGYVAETSTDVYGMAYFPTNDNEPLINGATYTLRANATEYNDKVTTVTVTGLEEVSIVLTEL